MSLRSSMVRILFLALIALMIGGCGGDGDDGQSSTWTVGATTVAFTVVEGARIPGTDLLMTFSTLGGSGYPNASLVIEYLPAVTAAPVEADDISLHLDADTSYSWSNPCEVIFTTLDLTNQGRIRGTINGELLADLDDDGEDEPYALSATFDGIFIDT